MLIAGGSVSWDGYSNMGAYLILSQIRLVSSSLVTSSYQSSSWNHHIYSDTCTLSGIGYKCVSYQNE